MKHPPLADGCIMSHVILDACAVSGYIVDDWPDRKVSQCAKGGIKCLRLQQGFSPSHTCSSGNEHLKISKPQKFRRALAIIRLVCHEKSPMKPLLSLVDIWSDPLEELSRFSHLMLSYPNSGDDRWLLPRGNLQSSEAGIARPNQVGQRRRSEPFALAPLRLEGSQNSPNNANSTIGTVSIYDKETRPILDLGNGRFYSRPPVPTYKLPSKHPPECEAIPYALLPDIHSMSEIEAQKQAPKTLISTSPTKSKNDQIEFNGKLQTESRVTESLIGSDHEPLLIEAQASTPKPAATNAAIPNYVSPQTQPVSGSLIIETGNIPLGAQMQTATPHLRSQVPNTQMTIPFDKLWPQIRRLRVNNWTLRSEIHEIRAKLREHQMAKSEADDVLFRRMTERRLLGEDVEEKRLLSGEKSTDELMQECQAIRDNYGPLEDSCNRLEDELSSDEFRQNQLEEELYKHLEQQPFRPNSDRGPPAQDNSTTPSFAPYPVPPESLETPELHPLVRAFLSRLGDLYLLIEEHGDLIDDKENLDEEKATRARVGLQLSPEDQTFLDQFEASESHLTTKINEIQREVEMMRKDCFERGLIDENDEPTDLVTQEKLYFREEKDLNAQETSEYVKYPLLLPRQGIRDGAGENEVEEAPDGKSNDTTNRINRWLFDKLRSSPLEVRLLASTFQHVGGGKTNDRWQSLVLDFWFRDLPIRPQDIVYSSRLATHKHSSRSSSHRFLD